MTSFSRRLPAWGVLATAPTLAAVAPSPSAAWPRLLDLRGGGTGFAAATAPLTAAVALGAWSCSAWLLLVVVVTSGGRLPGAVGAAFRRTADRVAPHSVRSLVRLAVGGTVAFSVLGGTSHASADSGSYDWPGVTTVVTTAPAAVRHHPQAPPASTGRTAVRTPSADRTVVVQPGTVRTVVVQPGDCLWAIAARELAPTATAAQVARAWPRWWAANRDLVGDDPDLIHPGTRLSAPRPD